MKNVDSPHDYSKASPRLVMRYNKNDLSYGSGLVIAHNGLQYLITAAHNLAGTDHEGNLKNVWIPDEVRLEGFGATSLLQLYTEGDASTAKPRYVCDAVRDVAIIRIQRDLFPLPLDQSFFDIAGHAVVQLRIGDVGSIVGYPTGIYVSTDQGPLPIWKSVTIASEPAYTRPDQPLLIDSWGEKGLSGAPMFVEKVVHTSTHKRLVGIYTGRQPTAKDDHGRTESLGRVTPLEIILELFYSKKAEIDRLAEQ